MTTDDAGASRPRDAHGTDTILTIAIQVVVAVAVWGLIGLLLDMLAGTAPWLQFAGILLGTMIGLVLVQRRATPAEPPDG